MSKVKIKTSDRIFSQCVRERAGWKCERCGAQHQEKSMGLHCSHFHGRGKWGVRFDPDNTEALCYGCHQFMGANPSEHARRKEERLGRQLFEILLEKANDTSLGRIAKRSEKEIREHYRGQLKRMKLERDAGQDEYLLLENWI